MLQGIPPDMTHPTLLPFSPPDPSSTAIFRRVLGRFATGVAVATTRDAAERPYGVTINSLTSLSLDPPLVLFCLGRHAHTFPVFCQAQSFALSILAEDQAWLSNRFSRREMEDRWHEVDSLPGKLGCRLLAGAVAGIECSMERIVEGGDHVIIIGRVQALREIAPEKSPLLYVQGAYRRLATMD